MNRWAQNSLCVAAGAALLTIGAPLAIADPIAPAPAPATPVTDHCPYQAGPPPAVDTSEQAAPGSTTPTPLPVPSPPVGGQDLGACGVVAAPGAPPVPAGITAAGWLIADLDSGKVIAAKDPHGRYRPASTIKTLLALVALKNLDLDKTVTGTQADADMEGDRAGIGPGGRYTVRQLLEGLLLVSGNDCANALAELLGGTSQTLEKMNDEAKALGAKDTRAASPSGLDAAGMSSSPYDLALIFRAAMQNTDFRAITAMRDMQFPGYGAPPSPSASIDPNNGGWTVSTPGGEPSVVGHPSWQIQNENALLNLYPGAIGGKTGYTDDARKTYIGAAERDGHRIVVTLMYGFNEADDNYWHQAGAMLDYGFATIGSAGVGSLATASDGHSSEASNGHQAPADQSDDSDSGSSSHWGRKIVYGLIGLAIVYGLVSAARRINRR
ncbi:D-alanyl-D-alanine carboxypeptidase family protein [Jongsikchunia kroppenstedtii]|uniref:D-alanyl-D-alanine carboxypeptidase family protein n=1 Tax=Jongsikchunia kroppenstedtii TaxID=1121721 RepID=UPI00035F52A1|nr:serine hydrolase [Jongsikchunia kroppenstedtii]